MSARDNLDQQVTGPVLELAAKVKRLLESDPDGLMVEMPWGNFYVKAVELEYYDAGTAETVGYLVPDEGDGKTFDFYTPKRFRADEDGQR